MTEQLFDIVFRGDIVFGHQLAEVKLKLQQLFKADAAKVDALFTGKPVPLKRGLDQASAQKYKDVLNKAGALVELVAIKEPAPTSSVPSPAPLTLAQRLQAQAAAEEAAQKARETQRQATEAQRKSEGAQQKHIIEQHQTQEHEESRQATLTPSWSLAPAGADLLQAAEKAPFVPAQIDTSAISLREQSGNLIDPNEQKQVPTADVLVPNYQVADAGEDLVRPEEKLELPIMEIELEDWTIAEAGADLINDTEKNIQPTPAIPDLNVGLAPVGSDLGQLKPNVKPVAPDTSQLRLVE